MIRAGEYKYKTKNSERQKYIGQHNIRKLQKKQLKAFKVFASSKLELNVVIYTFNSGSHGQPRTGKMMSPKGETLSKTVLHTELTYIQITIAHPADHL